MWDYPSIPLAYYRRRESNEQITAHYDMGKVKKSNVMEIF